MKVDILVRNITYLILLLSKGEIGEKITPNQFLEATGKNKPWTLIDGKVYNMQDMLTSHPGGPESIADIIGKDGTEPFMDHHAESEAAHK